MARTTQRPDIHNYAQRFAQAEQQVIRSPLSQRNKDSIFGYRDACLRKGTCGRVRLIRVMGALVHLGRIAEKDFDELNKEDIERVVSWLMGRQPPYTAYTLRTYRAILRRFLTWLADPDGFPNGKVPESVQWIGMNLRPRQRARVQRRELVTPAEVRRLLSACQNLRDQALLAVFWETGARPGELGNLQIKHVAEADYGYTLDVDGKTGERTPLLVGSAPYLRHWLGIHPFANDLDAPLWIRIGGSETPLHLKYHSIRAMVRRVMIRAGIRKPYYPYIFRHSRITYMVASGQITGPQAMKYFGWVPSSNMLSTYAHLTDQDAHDALLRANGLSPTQVLEDPLRPTVCDSCTALNTPEAARCTACESTMRSPQGLKQARVRNMKDELMVLFFEQMVAAGMTEQVLKKIHDDGLGEVLEQMVGAQQPRTTPPERRETRGVSGVKQETATVNQNGPSNAIRENELAGSPKDL